MPRQIFVEGDMVVFGYGGFYDRPKGWGLDVCYFHKKEFAWWRGRAALKSRLKKALNAEIDSGRLANAFVSQFTQRIERLVRHEWHYDRADLMFQSAKTAITSLVRYEGFPAFVKVAIAGQAFCTPLELEQRTHEYLQAISPQYDPLPAIASQNYLLFGFLLNAIKADMVALIGIEQGEWLFNRLLDVAPEPPRNAADLDAFLHCFLLHPYAQNVLLQWHHHVFSPMLGQTKAIFAVLKKMKVVRTNKSLAIQAKKAVMREAKQSLPAELLALIKTLSTPVFVSTKSDLGFFGEFHQPGYLVYRQSGTMHQMVGVGLCVHRDYARGGIFVSYDQNAYERFCHTLIEECTHFADGPQNRETLQGTARYSGTPEFAAAFAADYAHYAPWQSNKALGVREWGMILTQLHVGAKKIERLQKRIATYDAALDFRHYEPQEQMVEMFAALPVIEKAVGRVMARKVLPHMFAYYDQHYRKGLKAELKHH
jgi:hypothetical protein